MIHACPSTRDTSAWLFAEEIGLKIAIHWKCKIQLYFRLYVQINKHLMSIYIEKVEIPCVRKEFLQFSIEYKIFQQDISMKSTSILMENETKKCHFVIQYEFITFVERNSVELRRFFYRAIKSKLLQRLECFIIIGGALIQSLILKL